MNVNSAGVYVGKVAILDIALGPEKSQFWRCHFSLCKSIDFFVSGGSFLGAQTGGVTIVENQGRAAALQPIFL